MLLSAAPIGLAAETIAGSGPPWTPDTAASPQSVDAANRYDFFTAVEAAFIEAASERMIPKDELGPGAVEAGVPIFIDRQLAGDFGKATNWYMQGPWATGAPTQGYQSRYTPAQMYRAAIGAIDQATQQASGAAFAKLNGDDQDAFLKRLASGDQQLEGVDAKSYFKLLLQNVMEGFFSDPLYGGNRGMAGWKLIGFPGARYDLTAYVSQYGKPFPLPPVGITGRPAWTRS
ncbi:MAG TPA: gluconate 2-dehydrogenase subunit 3 family protein [Caulobacteraceae bacterium]|jgi:gluconate 2-dehydrogenase gamma chain